MLLLRTGLSLRRRWRHAEVFAASLIWVWRLGGRVDVGEPAGPIVSRSSRGRGWTTRRRLLRRTAPLRANWSRRSGGLIGLRMYISRLGSRWRAPIATTRAEKLQSSLDVRISGVKLGSSLIGIQGIGDLVVAGFILKTLVSAKSRLFSCRQVRRGIMNEMTYQRTQVIPNL